MLDQKQDADRSSNMMPFQQFVFFLSTAQEQLEGFVGPEKKTYLNPSYVGPELVVPGRYCVRDGVLHREDSTVAVEAELVVCP
jgi:hypothetical protein